jgi:hypothetical protein
LLLPAVTFVIDGTGGVAAAGEAAPKTMADAATSVNLATLVTSITCAP